MGRIGLAVRVFWGVVFQSQVAEQVRAALSGELPARLEPVAQPAAAKPVVPKPPARSEALTLLATLQREARFVDFIQEPIAAYSDAQIGAAVRDIHRDCSGMLERQFAIRPVLVQAEGSEVTIGVNAKSGRVKLTGKVGNNAQDSGTLVHHGWLVTKTDVPVWTGDAEAASIVTPAEVEVR